MLLAVAHLISIISNAAVVNSAAITLSANRASFDAGASIQWTSPSSGVTRANDCLWGALVGKPADALGDGRHVLLETPDGSRRRGRGNQATRRDRSRSQQRSGPRSRFA